MNTIKPRVRLFYALNGYNTIRRVHKIFYNKVFSHPWLGQYFRFHDQQFIEDQQTNFMAEKFGGPRNYLGKDPAYAHEHMYIPQELFDIRRKLLEESLREANIDHELISQWLKIDDAFRKAVVNKDLDEFYGMYTYKQRIVINKPD